MVNFETYLDRNQDNTINGIRLDIFTEGGDIVDSVYVFNDGQLEEKLERIDEKYVQTSELTDILTNVGEANVINASTLGGHSDAYYSVDGHNHGADEITGLYQYEIYLSNYNPHVGDNVVVTVKVTDYFGTYIVNQPFSIMRDGKLWKSGTSKNGGNTFTFTADSPGLTTFSVKNANVQCNIVDDWKQTPLTKELPFDCAFYVLESQRLANLYINIPRYVGWCDNGDDTKIVRRDTNYDGTTAFYIGENGFNGTNRSGVKCHDYVDNDGSTTYKFLGADTKNIIPTKYLPASTLSQPLWKGYWNVYLESDGSFCGTAYKTTTDTVSGVKQNWSLSIRFNQVWRY